MGPRSVVMRAARVRRPRASRLTRVRILTVVGNRPQFIKAAAVSGPLRERHEEILVHTGQHHDETLSSVFFAELGLARPDRELGIAGASNTSQTARMLTALEPLLAELATASGAGLRRHQLDARGRAGGGAGAASRWCTSRRACARSTARCRRSSTAC